MFIIILGKLPNGEFNPGQDLLRIYADYPILVVGAGGLGREVANWAIDEIKKSIAWIITGFLDDNPNALYGKQI